MSYEISYYGGYSYAKLFYLYLSDISFFFIYLSTSCYVLSFQTFESVCIKMTKIQNLLFFNIYKWCLQSLRCVTDCLHFLTACKLLNQIYMMSDFLSHPKFWLDYIGRNICFISFLKFIKIYKRIFHRYAKK